MEERHPWMKFFTWVTMIAGMIAVSVGFSEQNALIWVAIGVAAIIASVWALVGTGNYQRLTTAGWLSRLMALLSVLSGAMLSSFFIVFIFIAYAAYKQNQRDGL